MMLNAASLFILKLRLSLSDEMIDRLCFAQCFLKNKQIFRILIRFYFSFIQAYRLEVMFAQLKSGWPITVFFHQEIAFLYLLELVNLLISKLTYYLNKNFH